MWLSSVSESESESDSSNVSVSLTPRVWANISPGRL